MTDDDKPETAEEKFERFEDALKRVLAAPKPSPEAEESDTD